MPEMKSQQKYFGLRGTGLQVAVAVVAGIDLM